MPCLKSNVCLSSTLVDHIGSAWRAPVEYGESSPRLYSTLQLPANTEKTLLCLVWILERAVAETGSPLQISFASDNYTVKVDNESLGPLHGCTIQLKVATHLGVQLLVRMTSVSSTTFGGLSKHRLSVTFLQPTLLGRVQQGMKTSLCSAPAGV